MLDSLSLLTRQEKKERKRKKMEKNKEISEQVASLQSELTEIKKILLSQSQLLPKPAEPGPK